MAAEKARTPGHIKEKHGRSGNLLIKNQRGRRMDRHEKIVAVIFLICVAFLFLWCFGEILEANAHEGHGFKHMAEGTTTGPIIRAKYCPDMTLLNWIDYNNDDVVDACKKIIFIHEEIHIHEYAPVDNDCSCTTKENK